MGRSDRGATETVPAAVRHGPQRRERLVELKPKPPTQKGPGETFTGDVWLDPIYRGEEPSRARASLVRFSPAARTAWHSHGRGQMLYVTEGAGRMQARGHKVVEIHAGDLIYTPPDEEHWHGASPSHLLVHLSITESTGEPGRPDTEWGEKVTDAEYGGEA